MTEMRNWGHTVLGWFVVKDEAGTGIPDAEPVAPDLQIPADGSGGPTPPPVPASSFVKEPPKARGGAVDFGAVFDAAGIEAADRDLFVKAQALLEGLPAGTDPAVKRQIVEASLKAFGIPIDKIIESGAGSIQALEAYIQKGAADTATFAADVRTLVEGYEAKIKEARDLLDKKLGDQASVQTGCNEKKLELQRVLEFFGQDEVARVVQASPKLIDPAVAAERKG